MDQKVKDFLWDLNEVYKKHDMSLAHEDGHGAFIVEKFSERNVRWLYEAHIELDNKGEQQCVST